MADIINRPADTSKVKERIATEHFEADGCELSGFG
jgi:hypothetical protein